MGLGLANAEFELGHGKWIGLGSGWCCSIRASHCGAIEVGSMTC